MSLYEMHYVANAAEKARLKQQQKTMLQALTQLSTTARLQQQKETDKLLTRKHLATIQLHHTSPHSLDTWYNSTNYLNVEAECRPYSPYDELNTSTSRKTSVSGASCSTSRRQRTPSMTSTVSSFQSESESSVIHDSEEESSEFSFQERDQYGFKKPIQWIQPSQIQTFENKYQFILQKQFKSWDKLFMNNNQQWPELCPELTRYVKNGIPQHLRAKAWMHYSGADKKMKENAGRYQSLVEEAEALGNSNEYASVIQRDLHRTFPDNSFFACDVEGKEDPKPKTNEKIQQLRRILLAFSIHSSHIGYCQSLNFLTGFLLLFVTEEEAFWMLVTIIQDYFPKNMFDKTMEGANIEQIVLMMMIYEKMPGVWTKIANKKCFWECEQNDNLPPVTLVTSHWFLTMFINILPVETVLRVWDCFFVGEGFKVLYQVALTILKLNEQAIWNVSDSVDTFQILQNMPRRLIDCHEFIKSVFSPTGLASELTNQEIERKRRLFRNRKTQRTK